MQHLLRFVLIVLLATAAPHVRAYAQDNADDVAPETSQASTNVVPVQVIAPAEQTSPFDRVMYVLDVSGSMKEILPEAIRATDIFMSDGFQAAAVTFNDRHTRWAGVVEPCTHPPNIRCNSHCLPAGWCWMPKHREDLLRYLGSFAGDGNTAPEGAVEYALQTAPEGCLIVFISDGGFGSGPVVAAAQRGIGWRILQNLAPVQILVWSTVEAADKVASLVDLARIGGGGLWRAETATDRANLESSRAR